MSDPAPTNPGKQLGQGMLIICFVIALGALTLFFQDQLNDQYNPNRDPERAVDANGVKTVQLMQNRQGHYMANGRINGIDVTFLLDTGATDVAIPERIAQVSGLKPQFASMAGTANGNVTVYSTKIDSLEIGNIVLEDISASITPSMPGETILLGMSALRQIEFSQRGDVLTLRQFASY